MTPAAHLYPDDGLLLEVAMAARAAGMYLLFDGRLVLVSPIIPPGFAKLAVVEKPRPAAQGARS